MTITPINYLKVSTSNGVETIPVYALLDITNNVLRIYMNGQIGAFELVDINNETASIIKIFINGEIKAIGKTIQNGITPWWHLNNKSWATLNGLTWGDLKN